MWDPCAHCEAVSVVLGCDVESVDCLLEGLVVKAVRAEFVLQSVNLNFWTGVCDKDLALQGLSCCSDIVGDTQAREVSRRDCSCPD